MFSLLLKIYTRKLPYLLMGKARCLYRLSLFPKPYIPKLILREVAYGS
jgi:hypothetical protein